MSGALVCVRALDLSWVLGAYEHQKCMYELFDIVDEYFDAVDNSKEPPVEEFEKKASFAKTAGTAAVSATR